MKTSSKRAALISPRWIRIDTHLKSKTYRKSTISRLVDLRTADEKQKYSYVLNEPQQKIVITMSVNYPLYSLPVSKDDLAEKVLTWEKKIPTVQQPLLRNIAVSGTELSFVSSARNTGNLSKKTTKLFFHLFLLPCWFVLFLCFLIKCKINLCEIENLCICILSFLRRQT